MLLLGSALTAQSALTVVRIAGAAPLTGPDATSNLPIQNAAQMAVEEARDRFAQFGVKLEFVNADDQGSEEAGARVAAKVAADPTVLGVVGHVYSSISIKAMKIYAASGLLMISAASTNPAVTDEGLPNVNRVCGRDDVQGPIAAQFVRDGLGLRRVFVVNEGTQYGIGLANAFRKRATAIGLSVVGFVTNPGLDGKPLEADALRNLAQQIRLYQPQAVFYGGNDPQGGPIVKALRAAKFGGAIIGADGIDTENFVKLAGESTKGVYFTSTAGALSLLTGAGSFAKRYTARFKAAPEPYSPYGYDAANVVIDAIAAAFKASGNKLPTRAAVSKAARVGGTRRGQWTHRLQRAR